MCLGFGAVGVVAMSPVTVALSVTGWFLTQSMQRTLADQADFQAESPDVQYWARELLFRTIGLMALGAAIALMAARAGLDFHLSFHAQVLLTLLMIGTLVVIARILGPGFFAASWEVHGIRERRRRRRSSTVVARIIVRTVAAVLVATSFVSSFALMQSLRGGPRLDRMVAAVEIFSPSQTAAR